MEQCFYCQNELEGNSVHHVSFISGSMERVETLCSDCYYKDWLEGIKE